MFANLAIYRAGELAIQSVNSASGSLQRGNVIDQFSVDSFRLRLYNKISVYSLTQTFFRFFGQRPVSAPILKGHH